MSTFGPTGIWISSGGDPASVPQATAGMEISLRTKIVQTYADVAARDAAYTTLSSTGKRGIICWITNRGGHCYFDPTSNNWQWMTVHRQVASGTRASAADASGAATIDIILLPAVTLPPGNRLLMIIASSVVTNLSASPTIGRAFVGGLPDGDNFMQAALGGGEQASVARTWPVVKSGSVDYDLLGLTGTPANPVRFTNSWIHVYDYGPCDD